MANSNGGIVGVDNPAVVQPEVITTFNSSGTLTTAPYTTEVEYLVVAGGGGGGAYITQEAEVQVALEQQQGYPVAGGSPYPVVVGGGGAGGLATGGPTVPGPGTGKAQTQF
jgi:hypothetical protein